MKLTLGRDKKLKSRKAIEKLFSDGKKIHKFPIGTVYRYDLHAEKELKMGVSVPKKKFKKATDRNLLKRRIREAFRKNQYLLNHQGQIHLMFIYSASEIRNYSEIEKSMITLLGSLNSLLNEEISKR